MNRRKTGSVYEQLAADYLVSLGFRIISRNFRSRQGEIDIVASDGKYLVFAEVKQRSNVNHGIGAEAVTLQKQRRICMAARYYIYRYHISPDMPVRFDVISFDEGIIRLIRDAFPYRC